MASSRAGLELLSRPPASLAAGAGLVLPLLGRDRGGEPVELRAGSGRWQAAEACGVAPGGLFWALVPLQGPPGSSVELRGRTRATGGGEVLARLQLEAGPPAADGDERRIAICLPTFEPDPALLRGQLDSLRAQTHPEWICHVHDDASSPGARAVLREAIAGDRRFVLHEHGERAGVYRNVERALAALPAGAGLVALCDQDDRWAPDHLERLAALLHRDPRAALAHGDLRITDREGRVLAPSAWTERRRSEDRLRDLVTANTVTGSASLLRRRAVAAALPFPVPFGPDAFHDHWLALTAAATGTIAFTPQPVGDYVQHAGNVLGHRPLRGPRSSAPRAVRWQASAVEVLLWRQSLAATILLRWADRLLPRDRRELERTAAGPHAPLTLAARAAGGALRPRRTLGHEWRALRGALWLAAARRGRVSADLDGPLGALVSPPWPTASSSTRPPSGA